MARSTGGGPKARALGAELREVRRAAGIGVRELARRLQTNHVKLSRYESGVRAPGPEDVAAYLAAFGVAETERNRLVEMARDAREPNWLASGMPSIHRQAMSLIEFERTASHVVDVAPLIVPGLLQTADYARVIMDPLPPGECESRVALRLGRKDILTRRSPIDFTAVVSERVLCEPIGGPAVMADQLHHIAQLAELANVAVNVIRSGVNKWHLAMEGPFLLFEFSKAAPIVNLEHYRSPVFLYETNVVRDYMDAVTVLKQEAMPQRSSVELIKEIAREWEKET